MQIQERVKLYKRLFKDAKAVEAVKEFLGKYNLSAMYPLDKLEAIRWLNTELGDLYQISLPVITCWVRDNSYVPETQEIYLTEPDLEGFLHQWRHHLQNIERRYERRGLTVESKLEYHKIPYEDTVYRLRGEDDAVVWSMVIPELAKEG